jgi:5-formyltetrahydrofolate cyclo-ligase
VTKSEWRVWAKARRVNLDTPRLSASLVAEIQTLPVYQHAAQVLLYAPMPGEMNLMPLCQDKHKQFFLPRCLPESRLSFHRYEIGTTSLLQNDFGIDEPNADAPQWEHKADDLVIVPALLCDRKRTRLGYGGGYYDHFLSGIPLGTATLVALPGELIVDELPRDTWDVPIKWIISTETAI